MRVLTLIAVLICVTNTPNAATINTWKPGVITTYHKSFEGSRMTNGRRFSHRGHDVACRGGKLGQRFELRYGKRGKTFVTLSDRGGLPLHQKNRWQFDVSRQAAKELGLYRIVHGKTDRQIRWRLLHD